ncbi:alpha-1,2-fucosyltransferase [Polaromonas sp. SM01]|uniref:alpha-1,2-fucosyltransferase n=1 Tax=Polaromonas sp. SM01 TaxID=3085630 RepID=UPI002980E124|nr:alpha-1,2-fucosyltransferase [Polaromonas sp. SM01]MDW5443942.1 alpha-1,2-fucosyltransferase [Polaromonas sp. SM01]
MIITKLLGGLGNQMFQYAAGRSLALANECELKLDTSAFDRYVIHSGYALEPFNIVASIASSAEVGTLAGSSYKIPRMIRHKLGMHGKSYFREKGFDFDPAVLECHAPVYLEGYWQSYKYFEEFADQIRAELRPSLPLQGENLQLARSIAQENSVSVHVRRGDYVSNPVASSVHGFVGLAYYELALARISREINAPHFFVFSDDLPWARENLRFPGDVTFVDHNSGLSSYEDMRLMSLCKHHVMANSSFSWWAAWLGWAPGKKIFYPANWFSSKLHNVSSLNPSLWICVDPEGAH